MNGWHGVKLALNPKDNRMNELLSTLVKAEFDKLNKRIVELEAENKALNSALKLNSKKEQK